MTEQRLLDYEGLKFEKDCIIEDLQELTSKHFSIGSVNYERVGEAAKINFDDRVVNNMEKLTELNELSTTVMRELLDLESYFDRAFCVLDFLERLYCIKRYKEAKTNTEIAKELKCSKRKIYYLRKSILEKIKDI